MILGSHHENETEVVESGEYHNMGVKSLRIPLNMTEDSQEKVYSCIITYAIIYGNFLCVVL